jgi:hypothetical protein
MGKFMQGDIIMNEIGQQFLIVEDGKLRLISNEGDPLNDFKLVANTFPEMTERGVKKDTDYIELNTSELDEEDMFPSDIIKEQMDRMMKTGMVWKDMKVNNKLEFITIENGNI